MARTLTVDPEKLADAMAQINSGADKITIGGRTFSKNSSVVERIKTKPQTVRSLLADDSPLQSPQLPPTQPIETGTQGGTQGNVQQINLPTDFKSNYLLALQGVMRERFAQKGTLGLQAQGKAAFEGLATLPETTAATPGFLGLDLSQARRLQDIEGAGLGNLVSGVNSALGQRESRIQSLSELAGGVFSEQKQAEKEQAALQAAQQQQNFSNDLQIAQLQQDVPAGQTFTIAGKEYSGMLQPEPHEPSKKQIVPATENQPGGVFDPETGIFTPFEIPENAGDWTSWASGIGNGTITQDFNTEVSYIGGRTIHGGYDIDGKIGDPIPSLVAGTVVVAKKDGGWGNTVVVEDSAGNQWRFAHLDQIGVSVGQTVGLNSLVGTMGNTGNVTAIGKGDGSHLHFEGKDAQGNLIDPASIFGGTAEEGGYTDTQKAVMDSLDPKDIDSTDIKILKANGLTTGDFYSYISSNKKPLSFDKVDQIQTILDKIQELKSSPGKNKAVGGVFQKFIPGFLKPGEGDFLPGTDAATFASKFNSFRDNLALPSLDSLKGAMSDKDIQFLRSSATSLSLDMDVDDFDEELQNLEDKYKEILAQGTNVEGSEENKDDPGFWYNSYDPLYDEYGI